MPANESVNELNKFRLQQLKSPEPAGGGGGGGSPLGTGFSLGRFGGNNAGDTRPVVGSRGPGNSGTPGGVGVRFRVPLRAKGGTVDKADTKQDKAMVTKAVHKHESAMHKGKPKTKMAKGGSASKRADGCCSKGKTKGKFV